MAESTKDRVAKHRAKLKKQKKVRLELVVSKDHAKLIKEYASSLEEK